MVQPADAMYTEFGLVCLSVPHLSAGLPRIQQTLQCVSAIRHTRTTHHGLVAIRHGEDGIMDPGSTGCRLDLRGADEEEHSEGAPGAVPHQCLINVPDDLNCASKGVKCMLAQYRFR